MISKSMTQLVQGNSVIRALFEEGKEMAREVGGENAWQPFTVRKMFMISVWEIQVFRRRKLSGHP